jgi:hypothetical protein
MMPTIVTFKITGIASYSQSRPHLTDMLPNESHDDFRKRTWKNHLHVTKDKDKNDDDQEVFIPASAIKNCISEAAKFMNISVPGKGKNTYTKHFEAGVNCIKPVLLGIKKKDVQGESLFLPADGRRGSGKRVWKTYPLIANPWGGVVELIIVDETVLQTSVRNTDHTVLEEVVNGAGQYIGLGRFRPRQNGWYGRFTIEMVNIVKLEAAA